MASKTPLAHIVSPGEYSVRWFLPTDDGGTRPLEGNVDLAALRGPRGQMFGDVPFEWSVAAEGRSKFVGLPQRFEYPLLAGRLRSNHVIYLIDVTLDTWFEDRAEIYARCALVGLPGIEQSDVFAAMRVQTTFMDRIAGEPPLAKFGIPFQNSNEPIKWWAQQSGELPLKWESGSGSMRLGFDLRARTGDPYEMTIRYSPVVTAYFDDPLPLDEVLFGWAEPLRGISTIIMGKRSEITFVSLGVKSTTQDESDIRYMQLYGSGITQAPYAAQRWSGRESRPALTLKQDNVSLIDLVDGWRTHTRAQHPLYETYVSVLGVRDDHPRSRFLLLLQALEGHYGHERRTQLRKKQLSYEKKRESHIENLLSSGDLQQPTKTFLKKYLPRSSPRGLNEVLTWATGALPGDVADQIGDCALVTGVIASETARLAAEDPPSPAPPPTWQDALRKVRNDLAHGNRAYDEYDLQEVTEHLDRVVRAHVLRTLGAADEILLRLLEPTS